MSVDQKVLTTIQALMDRKDHPNANEHEAAVCAEKIQRLLLLHNIEMSQVEAHQERTNGKREKNVGHGTVSMGIGGKKVQWIDWCLELASTVSYACTCQYIWSERKQTITFVGSKTDIAVAGDLYLYLVHQIEDLSIVTTYGVPPLVPGQPTEIFNLAGRPFTVPKGFKAHYQRTMTGRSGERTKFRRGFVFGCAARVCERLYQDAQETRRQLDNQLHGQVTALVAVKDTDIREYIDQTFTLSAKPKESSKTPLAPEGYTEGYLSGDSVALKKGQTALPDR